MIRSPARDGADSSRIAPGNTVSSAQDETADRSNRTTMLMTSWILGLETISGFAARRRYSDYSVGSRRCSDNVSGAIQFDTAGNPFS
jgi:hypothetical protein